MKLAEEHEVVLVGVTEASVKATQDYREKHSLEFPILANGHETRAGWGVKMVWGNVIRLVNPEGEVVAEGLKGAARKLASRRN